jgi:hypothetical protein
MSKAIFEDLQEQIQWYKNAANHAMWRYRNARIVELIGAALIPFCSGYEAPSYRIAAGALGVVVVVATSMHGIFLWHDNWIRWRVTQIALTKEEWLYKAGVEPYSEDETRDKVLARRLAEIVSRENKEWKTMPQKPARPETKKT